MGVSISNAYEYDCFQIRDRFYSILCQLDTNTTISVKNSPNYFNISNIWRTNFAAVEEREFLKCISKWIDEDYSFFIFNSDNNKIALTNIGRNEISKIIRTNSKDNTNSNESKVNHQNVKLPLVSSSVEFVLHSFRIDENVGSLDLIDYSQH